MHLSAHFSHKDCNEIIDLLLQYEVQNIDIRAVEGRTPLQMAVRCGNAQPVKKLVDLGADFSLVKADKKDAVELERLYYEAESVEWKKKKALRGCNRCHYCFRYRNSHSLILN